MRTWSGARLWIGRPARALHPNRPPACSLAAFEPSLHFVDLVHALDDDAAGLGSRRARRYVLAQAAETLHQLGYRGLRARGLKGRHIEALVAEWRRQGLSDGTVKNRMAHLRWLAKKIGKPGIVRRDNASYGVGVRCAP